MSSLFLDTSGKITFGVLDGDLKWSSFESLEDAKASKVLHSLIFSALNKQGLELSKIENLFYLSGPGSYTGVRLACGFAEVLEWQGFNAYSCRHFEIPALLGAKTGHFFSKAFKREAFCYSWNETGHERTLLTEEAANEKIKKLLAGGSDCFTSEPDFYKECICTYDLIRERPEALFSALKDKQMKSEVFYYRDLEEEFQREK